MVEAGNWGFETLVWGLWRERVDGGGALSVFLGDECFQREMLPSILADIATSIRIKVKHNKGSRWFSEWFFELLGLYVQMR